MLVAAAVLFVACLALSGPASFRFVRNALPDMTRPVIEFDEGETRRFTPEPEYGVYWLYLVVDDVEAPLPPLNASVRRTDGGAVQAEPASGWAQLFGRKYRRFLEITTAGERPVEIRVVSGVDGDAGTEDFALLRRADTVLLRHIAVARPWWIAGGSLLVASVALVFAALISRIREPDEMLPE